MKKQKPCGLSNSKDNFPIILPLLPFVSACIRHDRV